MLKFIRNAFRRRPKRPTWHGSFLSEDEIVVDLLQKILADPETIKMWRDPASWVMPPMHEGAPPASENAGRLMFMHMSIRNHYGLWRNDNPYVILNPEPTAEGIIDHPQFPDNLSGRIVDRIRSALGQNPHDRNPGSAGQNREAIDLARSFPKSGSAGQTERVD